MCLSTPVPDNSHVTIELNDERVDLNISMRKYPDIEGKIHILRRSYIKFQLLISRSICISEHVTSINPTDLFRTTSPSFILNLVRFFPLQGKMLT